MCFNVRTANRCTRSARNSTNCYFFWNAAVARVGAQRAGTFIHLMPVFGAALASAFLGEALLWYHFAGALLIFSGIFAASRST